MRLPGANDAAQWSKLNDHLHDALRNRRTTTDVSADEAWVNSAIYDCLAQHCETVKPSAEPKREQKRARHMLRVRAQKRELRSAWRCAQKSGTGDVAALRATYLKLVRLHNKLRLMEVEKEGSEAAVAAATRFKKNPYTFGRDLLRDEDAQRGEPTFTQADAEAHFTKTYADVDRDQPFSDLPGLDHVAPPSQPFDVSPLTRSEFNAVLKSKSNGSAPGMNGIPYLVYKRCPHAADQLFRQSKSCLKSGSTPHAWGSACVILLAKSAKTDTPADFRPIALGNADGKVFFTLVQRRLTRYMLDNKYLDRSVQKGFIPNTAGCVDHATLLHTALRNARDTHRSICVSWLDLANAYGSVRHSLIRYALGFYHLPPAFVSMIMAYYDSLVAMVSTKGWETGFFQYAIGVFQGCTLSTILFDIVFNLLFEFLKSCPVAPFAMKEFAISLRELLYADDITFVTGGNYPARDNQRLISHSCSWLAWTRTMRFKPPKCRSLALRFEHKPTNHYAQYDPRLQIDGHVLACLGEESFKMLGRKLYASLSEISLQKAVEADLGKWMKKIDETPLKGAQKVWLYEHCVLARLTWPFIVYDFSVSLSERWTALCTKHVKRWLGVNHGVTPDMLYLQKPQPAALGLRSVEVFFKQMQTVRASLLKYSLDPRMVQLYAGLVQRDLTRQRWKATKCLEKAERDIACDKMCADRQFGKFGVGYFPRKKPPAPGTHGARREISLRIAFDDDQLRRVHLHGLAMQGAMMAWNDVIAQDLSWNRLMYGLSSSMLSFALKLNVNMLPTPDNLFRWRKGTHSCVLCHMPKVTPGHILSSCLVALNQGRFTYRHDQVLAVLYAAVCEKAASVKSAFEPRAVSPIKFVKAGTAAPRTRRAPPATLIQSAVDWSIIVDLAGHPYAFPLEVALTEKRPDIVMWSPASHQLVILELTVPDESRVVESQTLKRTRYAELVKDCEASSYTTTLLTVEIGVRGHVAVQTERCLKRLGIWSRVLSTDLSNAAMRGSYAIYINRNNSAWSWDVAVHGVRSGAVPSQ